MKKEKYFKASYALMATKTFNANQKLLLIAMLGDQELNGHINWSQSKYTSKINASRDFVTKFFNYLEFAGILLRLDEERSKHIYNRYKLDLDMLNSFIDCNKTDEFKSVVRNYTKSKKEVQSETTLVQSETTGSVADDYRECSHELQGVQPPATQHRSFNISLNRNQIENINSEEKKEPVLINQYDIDEFLREIDL